MENVREFEQQLNQCIEDAKKKSDMTDKTLAYVLLKEGIDYYLKQIVGEKSGIRNIKKHH